MGAIRRLTETVATRANLDDKIDDIEKLVNEVEEDMGRDLAETGKTLLQSIGVVLQRVQALEGGSGGPQLPPPRQVTTAFPSTIPHDVSFQDPAGMSTEPRRTRPPQW